MHNTKLTASDIGKATVRQAVSQVKRHAQDKTKQEITTWQQKIYSNGWKKSLSIEYLFCFIKIVGE